MSTGSRWRAVLFGVCLSASLLLDVALYASYLQGRHRAGALQMGWGATVMAVVACQVLLYGMAALAAGRGTPKPLIRLLQLSCVASVPALLLPV